MYGQTSERVIRNGVKRGPPMLLPSLGLGLLTHLTCPTDLPDQLTQICIWEMKFSITESECLVNSTMDIRVTGLKDFLTDGLWYHIFAPVAQM